MSHAPNADKEIAMSEIDLETDELIASLEETPVKADVEVVDEEEAEEETEPTGPRFSDFNFAQAVKKAVEKLGFEKPTEVQSRAIPAVLEGKDVLVTAQTGSGKTAAFLTPILTKMLEAAEEKKFRKALIIAPTRELAEQIGQVARELTFFARRFRYAVVIGGSGYGRQLAQLRERPAFVIGTPGRLIDHIERGTLKLDTFDFLVLDEADRMLDMGFEPQIEQIVAALPESRQTMMFSATMPPEVKRLVSRYLKEPVRISVGEENRPVDRIKQDVVELREADKEQTLLREIDKIAGSIIVFVKTKMKADRIAQMLAEAGHDADSLHGDLTQGARRRVTMNFREEKIRILVATDIAARGLDIDHIQHVVNYDLPMVIEDYVHRIGRTGRAGRDGHSIAFVTPGEMQRWVRILKMMGFPVPKGSGFTRDRGGRRNDGKFARPRPEGRGFRSKKFDDGGERPFRQRSQERPYDGGDSRPQRSFDDGPARQRRRFDGPQERPRFEDRSERPQRRDDSSGERPQKRAWSKGGGDRFRDDSHKRLPFKRDDKGSARGEGPRTWDTDERPKREFTPKREFGPKRDFGPKRELSGEGAERPAGPKRFGKGGPRRRDENWGRPWNPNGPVKKKPAASGGRGERY